MQALRQSDACVGVLGIVRMKQARHKIWWGGLCSMLSANQEWMLRGICWGTGRTGHGLDQIPK